MNFSRKCFVRLAMAVALVLPAHATSEPKVASAPLRIYIDADFSNHSESSQSIRRGIETALSAVDSKVQGRQIEVVPADHRGNTYRSKRHIKRFINDANALFMMSGIHSPPLISNREFINQNNVLFLVPWAAAGSITRPAGPPNWIFRLSIDDRKAGGFLIDYAVREGEHKRPLLLLENTSWGKFNHKMMIAELDRLGVSYDVEWFDWNIGGAEATALTQKAERRRNDVILLVANAVEGAVLAKALSSANIPVVSHWGITGGNFHEELKHADREALSLRFLQTGFSFLNESLTAYQKGVLGRAIALWPEYESAQDIHAPTGFVHAHDLTNLVLAGLKQVKLSGNIQDDRLALHNALESLKEPVQGLIKTYIRPYSPYTSQMPDAHEALGREDFAIGKFGTSDEIRLVNPSAKNAPK